MKEHEFAWAAGFFDGEGWVKIQKRGGEKYLGYYLRIGINHVKPEPLYKMQELFGGNIRYDDKVQGNRKHRHVWTLSTKAAAEMLTAIRPYLVNKCEECDLGLVFQGTMGERGQAVLPEVQEYREKLAKQIVSINAQS